MKDYQAYLFDFDGTLFDTYPSLIYVYREGFRAIGRDCTPEEAARWMHMSLSATLDKVGINDQNLRKTFMEKIKEALDYPEYLAMIKPFPEAGSVLKKLASQHKALGIVSGNTPGHIELILRTQGWYPYFSVVIGSDPSRRPKPFGDPILAARSALPAIPSDAMVYVGDSLEDPVTAKNGGIDGLLIDRKDEYRSYRQEKIASLKDLLPPFTK